MSLVINEGNKSVIYSTLNELALAMAVIRDGQVCFANSKAIQLRESIQGEFLDNFLGASASYAKERLHLIQEHQDTTTPTEYEFKTNSGESLFIEATAYPIRFFGDPAVIVIVQNITERNSDAYKAATEQQEQFHVETIDISSILINTVYIPAKNIGGDFYFFSKLSENNIIGVIGDVSGKGTLAAMMISSFEVLFRECAISGWALEEIVFTINDKIQLYFKEKYIAALFFSITEEQVKFCSCGINKYMTVAKDHQIEHHVIKGPFLGMMPSSCNFFEVQTILRADYMQLVMASDGLELLRNEMVIDCEHYSPESSAFNVSNLINKVTRYKQMNGRLKDDVAMICMDLNFKGEVSKHVLYGLTELKNLTEEVIESIENSKDKFNIKLILFELISNAFKYGNMKNSLLPMGVKIVKTKKQVIVKITDMAMQSKTMLITEELDEGGLLEDSGRGLFILSQICSKVYYDNNNMIAEYELGGN